MGSNSLKSYPILVASMVFSTELFTIISCSPSADWGLIYSFPFLLAELLKANHSCTCQAALEDGDTQALLGALHRSTAAAVQPESNVHPRKAMAAEGMAVDCKSAFTGLLQRQNNSCQQKTALPHRGGLSVNNLKEDLFRVIREI